MLDLIFIAAIIGFFAAAFAYVSGADALQK